MGGAFSFDVVPHSPWNISKLKFFANDNLVVTIPVNFGSSTISICPDTDGRFTYGPWNGGQQNLDTWFKFYWQAVDAGGTILGKTPTIQLKTQLHPNNLLIDSFIPLKLTAPRPFYGKNKFYDIYLEELFDWWLAEIQHRNLSTPNDLTINAPFAKTSASYNRANFRFYVYKFCQPSSSTKYDIVDPTTLRGYDAVNEAYMTGTTLFPNNLSRPIYRVAYDKSNPETRIKHSHPMFLPLYIAQLYDPYLLSIYGITGAGGGNIQDSLVNQNKGLLASHVIKQGINTKGSYKRLGLKNFKSSVDFTESTDLLFSALKTAKDNGISDFALNMVRPTYPCAVRTKDSSILFIDALRAKADSKITDQSLLGKFRVLNKDGSIFNFTNMGFPNTQEYPSFIFWDNSGNVVVTDAYLRHLASDNRSNLREVIKIPVYGELIDRQTGDWESLRGGIGQLKQGFQYAQFDGEHANSADANRQPITICQRPAIVPDMDVFTNQMNSDYHYSDLLYLKFIKDNVKGPIITYGSNSALYNGAIDFSHGIPASSFSFPNYVYGGGYWYAPPLFGFYLEPLPFDSKSLIQYYYSYTGFGIAEFPGVPFLGAFVLRDNGDLWSHLCFNGLFSYLLSDNGTNLDTTRRMQKFSLSDLTTPDVAKGYQLFAGGSSSGYKPGQTYTLICNGIAVATAVAQATLGLGGALTYNVDSLMLIAGTTLNNLSDSITSFTFDQIVYAGPTVVPPIRSFGTYQ